jgi:NADPH-dependent curcumin reductase CurA
MNGMTIKIVLNSKSSGKPTQDNFKFIEEPMPYQGDGDILIKMYSGNIAGILKRYVMHSRDYQEATTLENNW